MKDILFSGKSGQKIQPALSWMNKNIWPEKWLKNPIPAGIGGFLLLAIGLSNLFQRDILTSLFYFWIGGFIVKKSTKEFNEIKDSNESDSESS